MPKILVCYKWVLDEQDIRITVGDLSLDTGRAKYKISEYDKNAIEEAVRIVEQNGGSVEAITFGTPAVKQSAKDVLSRGADKVYFLADPAADEADAFVTANVLAAAVRKIGHYDLIICGDGSSDAYNQQLASRLAVLLGVPGLPFVNQVKLDGDKITVARRLGNSIEVSNAEFPAVISVLPEINQARIPGLKQVLAAAKKPVQELKVAELGLDRKDLVPKVTDFSVRGYIMERKNVIFKAPDPGENVAALVKCLVNEGFAG